MLRPYLLRLKNRFGFAAIKRTFYRYQPFGEPLSAVHLTTISRSSNRYYLFTEVLLAVLKPTIVRSYWCPVKGVIIPTQRPQNAK